MFGLPATAHVLDILRKHVHRRRVSYEDVLILWAHGLHMIMHTNTFVPDSISLANVQAFIRAINNARSSQCHHNINRVFEELNNISSIMLPRVAHELNMMYLRAHRVSYAYKSTMLQLLEGNIAPLMDYVSPIYHTYRFNEVCVCAHADAMRASGDFILGGIEFLNPDDKRELFGIYYGIIVTMRRYGYRRCGIHKKS